MKIFTSLEENNSILENFKDTKVHSKSFFPEATIQDFPIRGKNVYLQITRRRWFSHTTGKIVTRDWSLVAKGTRMTNEFAAFFKRNQSVITQLTLQL